jgi:hypothetical protein
MSGAPDLHDLIEWECRVLQSKTSPGGGYLTDYPNALALIDSAIAALEKNVPDSFEHEGRTYRLTVMLRRIDLGINADAVSRKPLLRLETESLRWCGYRPGH